MSVTDLNAHRPPVTYTVRIRHYWNGRVVAWIQDVADDEKSRESVAYALRAAAEAIDPHTTQGEMNKRD